MATMISEVYNAFLAGGAPEAEARKAAEALSSENLSTKGDISEVKEEVTGRIAGVEQKLTRDIAEVKEELTGRIAGVEQKLTRDIAEVKEELTGRIAGVEQKLTRDIAEVKEELTRNNAAVEERLNHKIDGLRSDIVKLDRDMAVMKSLLLIILAAQVIPLLKALSVI